MASQESVPKGQEVMSQDDRQVLWVLSVCLGTCLWRPPFLFKEIERGLSALEGGTQDCA